MKRFGVALLILVFAMSGCITASTPQKNWGELQGLPFPENYPTKESADRLYDEVLFQRACQVVIWSQGGGRQGPDDDLAGALEEDFVVKAVGGFLCWIIFRER